MANIVIDEEVSALIGVTEMLTLGIKRMQSVINLAEGSRNSDYPSIIKPTHVDMLKSITKSMEDANDYLASFLHNTHCVLFLDD